MLRLCFSRDVYYILGQIVVAGVSLHGAHL